VNIIQRFTPVLVVPMILGTAWSALAADGDNPSAPDSNAAGATVTAATAVETTPMAPSNAAPATSEPVTSAAPAPATRDEPPPPAYSEVPREDAGPKTLFGSHPKLGGFGGISALYSRFAGKNTGEFCLEGGLLIDRKLSLGLAGCGLTRSFATTKFDPDADPEFRTRFGYAGALIRYHFATYEYFNFAVGTLVGGGAITSDDWDHDGWRDDRDDKHPDAVFVIEPHLAAYLTMTRWLRVGATGGYRFVGGVDKKGMSASDLAAPTLGVQVQAGWF
jgi:hypothetical protein